MKLKRGDLVRLKLEDVLRDHYDMCCELEGKTKDFVGIVLKDDKTQRSIKVYSLHKNCASCPDLTRICDWHRNSLVKIDKEYVKV